MTYKKEVEVEESYFGGKISRKGRSREDTK